jgi:tetratricopeptide (TPR) repeat protein
MTGLVHTRVLSLITCALVAATEVASAQPSAASERARLIQAAEEHERNGAHRACAETYLQLLELDPKAQRGDQFLYNAGHCFEEAREIGRAIQIFERLEKSFPKSPHTRKALVRIGSAAAAVANFEKAADAFERYARRYAGEKDAPQALANAITYRRALGHHKEARSNIESFVKNYKKKRNEESAAALFGLAEIYQSQGDRSKMVKAYRRYIRDFGRSGGKDRLLIAHARIGESLWKQSCIKAGADGSCVRVKRIVLAKPKEKVPRRCGSPSTVGVEVLPRNKRLVDAAKKEFAKVLALHRGGAIEKVTENRQAAARYWVGATRFYTAQEDFEELMSLQFPRDLDFSPTGPAKAKESERRFSKWLGEMSKQSKALQSRYTELATLKGAGLATWVVAATARAGQVSRHFSDALAFAEIPSSIRRGPYAEEGVKAYCDALKSAGAPLADQAAMAFAFGLEKSQNLNHSGPWTRLCERQLSRLLPEDFPPRREVHGEANAVGDIMTLEGLASDQEHHIRSDSSE